MNEKNDEELLAEMIGRYKHEFALYRMQYMIIGRLLDKKYINDLSEKYPDEIVYVYGDNYLGLQTYIALKEKYDDIRIVCYGGGERWGENADVIEEATELSVEEFIQGYEDGLVLISILDEGEDLREQLIRSINSKKIFFVNELVSGSLL